MVHFYKVYKGFAKTCVNFAIQYLKLKPEVSRQKKTVLNHDLLFRSFNHTDDHRTSYAWSHGADGISYVGSGILYFAIPYMLKAQTCVCIGSGGGYVPRFMYQAQREANVQNARTILIDADKGDCGRPNYLRADSAFRRQFPEIEFVNVDSADYVALAKRQNLTIDYLHIDGDHSYEGALADFLNYFPLMSIKGLVTLHDTNGRYSCADVVKTLKDMGYTIINLPDVGEGIAIISVQRAQNQKSGILNSAAA